MGSNSRSCGHLYLWCLLSMICYFSSLCSSADTISKGQSLRDGEVIVSGGQKFALGFFSPENSELRYVGIWYQGIPVQTVVWVANRERPVSDGNGVLTIMNDGNLVVLDGNGDSVWSTNISVSSQNTTAVLVDTGELFLYVNNSRGENDIPLWQSIDYPTDTFLPDMRAYMNVQGEETRLFTSWRSASDPSPGRFSMGIDPRGSPQIVVWEGGNRHWRSGHWNGLVFIGLPDMLALFLFGFRLFSEDDGRLYFVYTLSNSSVLEKFQLLWNGNAQQQRWDSSLRQWSLQQSQPQTECDLYNQCGPFGICDSAISPICTCMTGFVPKNVDQWINGNWSGGCIRRTNLQCNSTGGQGVQASGGERDGFFRVEGVKLPDFLDYVGSDDIRECENKCLQNCSCAAFSFVSGINCMMWGNDLIDTQHFAQDGNTLYIRLAGSELGSPSNVTIVIIIVTVVVGAFFLGVFIWLLWRHKKKLQEVLCSPKINNKLPESKQIRSGESSTDFSGTGELHVEEQQGTGPELAYFSFSSLAAATNNFSKENKLGQGGFGHVYRGILPGGQEIAVKRLSRKSGQGLEEFKNEITLIAKLQHRNLVRLLGCCIQGEEKILLYEYMANKSLDSFLFDPTKQNQLDWRKRFSIIEGITRGLLYLHRDSRFRIIHRDLKASNILLDEDMNPKISDFGMARIFGGSQKEDNTNRVVGTYGYMAPEYAMEGLFSTKSDVYSFGILLLEIVSGRRNTSFRSVDYSNIIGYAWDLWDRGKAIDLLDPSIAHSSYHNEVLKCIHIAMLCVQDSAAHRPNMSAVVLMLEGENATLPQPRQPAATSMRSSANVDTWNEYLGIISSNNVTVSVILGR